MARRTGNNYTGPRWAFATRTPKKVVPVVVACPHSFADTVIGSMGSSGGHTERIVESRCVKCGVRES